METDRLMSTDDASRPGVPGTSTPGQNKAKASITRTTITRAPGEVSEEVEASSSGGRMSLRRNRNRRADLEPPRAPLPGPRVLRITMTSLLSVLCLLTIGGAILMLLLWQQDQASGVLTSQIARTWDIFDALREIERWIAFVLLPISVAWIALAAINVGRATGRRRNPIVAGLSLLVGVSGIWLVADRIVADADDWVGEVFGMVLQAAFAAIPLLAIERIAEVAEARRRPLRAVYVISVAYIVQLQTLGGLSTVDQTSGSDRWARLGAYLVIGGLIQLLGTLAVSEAARAIEEGTDHRFQIRQRFGQSLLLHE